MTEPVDGKPTADPVDRLILQLRAYIESASRSRGRRDRQWISGVAVIFDTETTVDPSQRLRFGAYQVREGGGLLERGLFHADDIGADDLAALKIAFAALEPTEAGEHLRLLSRTDFVDRVIYKWGLEVGGLIVGFNLPFDISRIAIAHSYGKGSMQGGFSFTLAGGRPNLRVKHLSQRASFINFAGRKGDNQKGRGGSDRGFFVDVKTLAAALTGQSHSLESLTGLLAVTPKSPLDDYSGPLTPEMVAYCENDVQATWECFAELAARYETFGLSRTGLHDLYSEASLGKAYLQAMGVKPWRETQPDFPPELIGQIMSAYYGGRAEVHIRREITPVIHCDFLSMYPTVCTLMGLWSFVIAEGVAWRDATEEVRGFVEACGLDQLRDPATWRTLHCIVQVSPQADVFPVRAFYEPDKPATIGVNKLTSTEPLWFTLADVLAAKLLGGKTPEILRAVRFAPMDPQPGLRSIALEGEALNPTTDDFYARLINQRRRIQAQADTAADEQKAALNAAQQGLKILANSTSYGIFMELNVQSLARSKSVTFYDFRGVGQRMTTSKVEEPGRYFHPLLGAPITGAARLMLACAERNALDQGLDWAFCDTDSLAIANTTGLAKPEFIRRVRAVLAWFEPLNPYDVKGSILQLEKVDFPLGEHRNPEALRPLSCLAISAKRYVQFDRAEDNTPVIRKATAHGLGHLLAPYKDPDRKRIGRIGAQLWQEDLWREIILAHDAGRPDQPNLDRIPGLDQPAATRYAVTNQTFLHWFKGYNEQVADADRVAPFNFLLTYQPKSRVEMAASDPEGLRSPAWTRRTPKPASRYSTDIAKDQPEVFDRSSGAPIPWPWLRSYRRALAAHHLHPETKFQGGQDDARGVLARRHVKVWAALPIGKEADNLEEREFFGEDEDAVEWGLQRQDRRRLLEGIEEVLATFNISDRTLIERAGVSHHTLSALRKGGRVAIRSALNLARAAEDIRQEATLEAAGRNEHLEQLRFLRDRLGSGNKAADVLGVTRPYLHRVLTGQKPLTDQLMERLQGVLANGDI